MLRVPVVGWFVGGAAVVLMAALSASVSAQSDVVAYHDLSAMATWPLGKMQVKGAMGQSASFALVELPQGFRQTPHHHAQEQIVFGVGGATEMVVGGTTHRLGSYGAVVTPSNSQHGSANGGSDTAAFIEFQAVQRVDWFPPHQKYVPAVAAAPFPVPVAEDRRVFLDFAPTSDAWHVDSNGARSKVLSGETIRLTVWDLSAAKASADLVSHGGRVERLVYVIEGQVAMTIDGKRRDAGLRLLSVVSAGARNAGIQSAGKGRTLVAVFEPLSAAAPIAGNIRDVVTYSVPPAN